MLRKTISKRCRSKLRGLNKELKQRRHLPIPEQGKWLRSVVQGHLNYYAVPSNYKVVSNFVEEVKRLWLMALRRRSQKTRMTWDRFGPLVTSWLPRIRILHPYPEQRFAVMHPR